MWIDLFTEPPSGERKVNEQRVECCEKGVVEYGNEMNYHHDKGQKMQHRHHQHRDHHDENCDFDEKNVHESKANGNKIIITKL